MLTTYRQVCPLELALQLIHLLCLKINNLSRSRSVSENTHDIEWALKMSLEPNHQVMNSVCLEIIIVY